MDKEIFKLILGILALVFEFAATFKHSRNKKDLTILYLALCVLFLWLAYPL